jgi:hypothetical protein
MCAQGPESSRSVLASKRRQYLVETSEIERKQRQYTHRFSCTCWHAQASLSRSVPCPESTHLEASRRKRHSQPDTADSSCGLLATLCSALGWRRDGDLHLLRCEHQAQADDFPALRGNRARIGPAARRSVANDRFEADLRSPQPRLPLCRRWGTVGEWLLSGERGRTRALASPSERQNRDQAVTKARVRPKRHCCVHARQSARAAAPPTKGTGRGDGPSRVWF